MRNHHQKISSELGEADLDLLIRALSLVPELFAATIAAKRAHTAGIRFPVTAPDDLVSRLGDRDRIAIGNHIVDADAVRRHLPGEFFPIGNQDELLGRFYLAFVACRDAARRPAAWADGDPTAPVLTFLEETPDDAEEPTRDGKA